LEYIDLLQCHRFDNNTPIEETASPFEPALNQMLITQQMQALHDVVKAGYVRYIGMSSCYAYQCSSTSHFFAPSLTDPVLVAQMQNYAINNRLTPFISMQNHYNAIYREEEREMIPTLKVSYPVSSSPI
jgi:aryl-alcohol dehydrogenase-like predicted oxidoreductase